MSWAVPPWARNRLLIVVDATSTSIPAWMDYGKLSRFAGTQFLAHCAETRVYTQSRRLLTRSSRRRGEFTVVYNRSRVQQELVSDLMLYSGRHEIILVISANDRLADVLSHLGRRGKMLVVWNSSTRAMSRIERICQDRGSYAFLSDFRSDIENS